MTKWCDPPDFLKNLPPQKLKTSWKRGLAYERTLARNLPDHFPGWTFRHGAWIENEGKFFQPDFVIESPGGLVVLADARYSYSKSKDEKILKVYLPLLRILFPGRDFVTIQFNRRCPFETIAPKEIPSLCPGHYVVATDRGY